MVGKNYYFNNWMTLLSQLPLLLFTLLNSILYQRSEVVRRPDAPPGDSPHLNCFFSASRISEAIRIAGSLIFVLLLFIFTAVLVKVPMDADRFFSITMATIWFINCEWASPLLARAKAVLALKPRPFARSFRRRAAGQPVRPGGSAASEVQRHLHERPGPRRNLCCRRNAVSHRQ